MEIVTASLILSATLMMLGGLTLLVLMSSTRPLVQIVNPPAQVNFTQDIRNAYFRSGSDGTNGLSYGAT